MLTSSLRDMAFYQLATGYPVTITRSFGGYAAGSGALGYLEAGFTPFSLGWHSSGEVCAGRNWVGPYGHDG